MVYLLLQGNAGPSLFKGMVDPFHLKMIDLFYQRWFAALLENSDTPFANCCLARSLPSSPPNQVTDDQKFPVTLCSLQSGCCHILTSDV